MATLMAYRWRVYREMPKTRSADELMRRQKNRKFSKTLITQIECQWRENERDERQDVLVVVQRLEHDLPLLAERVLEHDFDGGYQRSQLPVADLKLELVDQTVLLLAFLNAGGTVLFVQIDAVQMLRVPGQHLIRIPADLLPFVVVTVIHAMHLTHRMSSIIVTVALEWVR